MWLQDSKLSLEKVVLFLKSWEEEYITTKLYQNQLNIVTKAIRDWKCYLREVCADSLLKKKIQ